MCWTISRIFVSYLHCYCYTDEPTSHTVIMKDMNESFGGFILISFQSLERATLDNSNSSFQLVLSSASWLLVAKKTPKNLSIKTSE